MAVIKINEVCYENSKVADETGNTTSDWIELYNSGTAAININNYGIGDANPYEEAKGVRLPNYLIPAGGFLVIFANSDLPEYTAWTNAEDVVAIPENSLWKSYFNNIVPPVGTGSTTWKQKLYIDSTWQSGISPLGHNTTIDSADCATLLGNPAVPATLYPTAYFRKKFTIPNPSVVTGLVMKARIKDGMVVYLNNTEIHRQNMPSGAITHNTPASTVVPSTLWTTTLLDAAGLTAGENILAIEVHKASQAGTAIIMDMTLTALINQQRPTVHGQFGLKKDGENVHLFNASLLRIDKVDAPTTAPGENNSYGAVSDGGIAFQIFTQPTPGRSNAINPQKYSETLVDQKPIFTAHPGFYASTQNVLLKTPAGGHKIYYTLDGSDPWESTTFVWSGNTIPVTKPANATSGLAWKRTNPVEVSSNVPDATWQPPIGSIDKAVVLRAIAVNSAGTECSPETSGTYFIGAGYSSRSLPVFSLILNQSKLFGFVEGLFVPGKYYADSPEGYGSNRWGKPYANYHQAWEYATHLELFEANQSTAAVAMQIGVTMHGGGSRTIPQKTLYLLARNKEYGAYSIDYPFFPELPATSYKRFLLRNSGNDWYGATSSGVATMIKDMALQEIASPLKISVQAGRPALVYINGEYWGIHNLRESYDKHYLATRYSLDPENVDILSQIEDTGNKISISRLNGDKNSDEEFEELLDWIKAHPLSNNANYQTLTTQIDVNNYADYIIAETFVANTDWPQNNCDFWRAHTNETAAGEYGDGRWRWMLYDLDVAGEKSANYNMFDYLTDNSMTAVDEAGFLINELWKNMTFRNLFVSRYADILNTSFTPRHTSNTIAAAAQRIVSELDTHFARWGRTTTTGQWQAAVNSSLIQYNADRYNNTWGHLNSHFNLGGTGRLTLKNQSSSGVGGNFSVNSMTLTAQTDGVDDPANWSGIYFQSLPVAVEALPESGYLFDGWVGSAITTAQRTVFVSAAPATLVARFRPAAAPPYTAVGYEAWQLSNYSEQAIVSGTAAAPDSPSGKAGLSNFELYAFGMHLNDGLSDAQRLARASLSINRQSNGLWVGYNRLNSSFTDLSYTLKTTDSLSAPLLWRTAVLGEDILNEAETNALDSATWFFMQRLNNTAPDKDSRFFKLEIEQASAQ
ncbi:MAG: CotH kinase family protein [Kiritimatiellae bacterium]|nr:CotH kinase family protein [Kiritimatiellia bacterium]